MHAEIWFHADVRKHAGPSEHHGLLGTDYRDAMQSVRFKQLVYSGPVDEYFDFRFGELPYRSLRFEHKTLRQEYLQPVAVVNYPNDHEYTRVTEFKYLTGQAHRQTSVVYEYPEQPKEIRTIPFLLRRMQLSTSNTRNLRPRSRTCTSSAGWLRTATTTWIRLSARLSRSARSSRQRRNSRRKPPLRPPWACRSRRDRPSGYKRSAIASESAIRAKVPL